HPPAVSGHPLGQVRRVLRWMSQARHTGKLVLDVPAGLDPQGTVLVTGGTGTLGGLVAQHLVRAWGVRHLLLASRRGEQAPGVQQLVDRLRGLGARVRVVAVDVADPAAVARLVAGVDPGHPLTGVVHAAGVIEDAVLASQARQGLARVWRAKATAAANLHEATRHLPLAAFIMFSSFASALGTPGQANYAAANAYCDALAIHRQSLGLPGLSIAWGLWATTSGLTGQLDEAGLARIRRLGINPTSTNLGLALLDAAYRHGHPQLLAYNLDTRALARQPAPALPPALRSLAGGGARSRRTASTGERPTNWSARLSGVPHTEQHRMLLDLVRKHAATVLGHGDSRAVHVDATFKELGFDSLTAVELRNRLAAATGLRLPAALVFDYPEVTVLADHLRRQLSPNGEAPGQRDRSGAVLKELARIENTLSAATAEDLTDAVMARLETLLATVKARRVPVGDGDAVERLQTASAAQILDFIDSELGLS
ncbi:MAG TPA: SDR family NAD(P)-dependent oxidoreductase, partial [Micromonosporaceae bacterium]|nr:SDR family NAD(P)-dependent oxidoreductase [Micromonosporaceae bacterium]